MAQERLLKPVIDTILSAVLYCGSCNPPPPAIIGTTRSKEVRNVRRHACSLLVKISLTHSSLLASIFDYLKLCIDKLSNEGHLMPQSIRPSRMEIVTITQQV